MTNLNYDKLHYKKQEVDFMEKLIQHVVTSQLKVRCLTISNASDNLQKAGPIIYWHD